ncbi:MAG: formylglycine-generating enzyme family protein [Planctomycetota bacterium]
MKRPVALIGLLCCLGCPQQPATVTAQPGPTMGSPTPSASATPGPAGARVRRGELPLLPNLLVPAGEFTMGSEGAQRGGQDSERPRAKRRTEAFSIDRCEVTNEAYAKFLASPDAQEHAFCHRDEPANKDHRPGLSSAEERAWGAVAEPYDPVARAKHPVVCVDWWDAYAFAAWAGRRLPSEDEWERAARGEDGRTYPWGEAPPSTGGQPRAVARLGRMGMTAEVGSLPAGAAPSGALDMAGNVWEWTDSPFLPYEGAPEPRREDPDHRVIRGGGWTSAAALLLRCAMRHDQPRDYRGAALGFRTAGDAQDLRGAR